MLKEKVTQVQRTTIAQNIVTQLIEIIINGTVGPGEKLPSEKQLMELFGVGRSSLREAIRALVALGLVEIKVPDGTFVTKTFGDFFTKNLAMMSRISFENVAELVEARTAIESDIAELAGLKATDEDVEALLVITESMRTANSNERFQEEDLKFHLTLARIANNSFMLNVMNILRDITTEWINRVIQFEDSKEIATKQHERIVDAIRHHQPGEARAAMRDHLHFVGERLLHLQQQSQL